MKCGLCEKIKNLRKFDILLILAICFFLYIGAQLQVREFKSYKEQHKQESNKIQDKELQIYEALQRKCYFKNDKNSCEKLKEYE